MLEESLLVEAKETEDPACICQWDAGNKHRAKQAAKAVMQEAIAEEAKRLAVQGEWFRLAEKAKNDTQWGGIVRRLKEETREWCIKAALRTLPDATNKRRWGWCTTEESRCKCGKIATDAHILNGCSLALLQMET